MNWNLQRFLPSTRTYLIPTILDLFPIKLRCLLPFMTIMSFFPKRACSLIDQDIIFNKNVSPSTCQWHLKNRQIRQTKIFHPKTDFSLQFREVVHATSGGTIHDTSFERGWTKHKCHKQKNWSMQRHNQEISLLDPVNIIK